MSLVVGVNPVLALLNQAPDRVRALHVQNGRRDRRVAEVIAANPKMVEEFMSGKDKALNAMVGQVMKKSAGKANPQTVTDLLRKALNRPD